jgi:tRNA(fMet)-specific endonuclease VapC
MTEIVVDTDVISFGFRNDSRFRFYMAHMQGLRPLMSFMTSAEIEFGVIRRNWGQERRQRLEQYLSQYYSVIHSNDALCRVWAHLKAQSELAGKILPEADAWNAALAVLLDVPLLSHNRKHYEHLRQLKLISMPD